MKAHLRSSESAYHEVIVHFMGKAQLLKSMHIA